MQGKADQSLDPKDLDLVDDSLADEGKDDAALWAEFDQAEDKAAATDTNLDDASPGDEPGDDDAGGDAAAADDEGQAKKPDSAAQAGGEQSPSGDAASGGEQPSDDAQGHPQNDLWANASPDQRAAFEAAQAQIKRLEQAERSNRGRLSALQRQLNEQRQPSKAAPNGAADNGQQRGDGADAKAEANVFLASEEWKGFVTEYPEVAGPLGKVIGELQAEVTRQRKELSAIGADRREAAVAEQEKLLVEQHPDWETVTAEAGFVDWLNQQPRHIREAAVRNAEEIVDAAEAADVVGRFKDYRASQGQGAGGTAQQSSRADAGRGTGTTQALSGKRQRQLESASAARSRGPGVAVGIPEDGDEETLWKQFDEMERRQARA